MTMTAPVAAVDRRRSVFRPARALWHLFRMFVDVDHQPRHGALFVTLTEGNVFERNFAAFQATTLGRALIRDKPDTAAILGDKDALAKLPEGSFGKTYAQFMRQAGLDEGYYSSEGRSVAQREALGPDRYWFRVRSGFTHDIHHMLTGYGPTPLGEGCLMAFRFAQLRHPGLGVLCVLQFISAKIAGDQGVLRSMMEAFRRGWKTTPFEMLPWEHSLHVSLASHRSWLGLSPSQHYPKPIEPDAFHAVPRDWSRKLAPDDAG